jgi:glycosyltransferase involved in cell wall biosynthesis
VVEALVLAEVCGELHLRGSADAAFVEALQQRLAHVTPRLRLEIHGVERPDRMVELCRDHDVGLAPEPGSSVNNALSLSNKALTYPLAGLALVLTDTLGHRPLIDDLGGDALVYEPGDVAALARGLKAWAADKAALERARAASWRAAIDRWHWDGHDRETLLSAVQGVLA